MKNLLISHSNAALSWSSYQVVNLDTGAPISPPVQIQRRHLFSLAYDVFDNNDCVIGVLSPNNPFLDNWRIKDTVSGCTGVVSRDIPAEWFTKYQIISEGLTICVFRQSNTVTATEFVAEFADELSGWSENLFVSVPLVMMASNPFICSFQGGCM